MGIGRERGRECDEKEGISDRHTCCRHSAFGTCNIQASALFALNRGFPGDDGEGGADFGACELADFFGFDFNLGILGVLDNRRLSSTVGIAKAG